MENFTLHLVLKSQWYDMIKNGIKEEEYREIGQYWFTRIFRKLKNDHFEVFYNDKKKVTNIITYPDFKTNFTHVCFHKGYTSETITFDIKDISVRTGNPEWGAIRDKRYIVIAFDNTFKKKQS